MFDADLTGTPVSHPEFDFPDGATRDAAYAHLEDMRRRFERTPAVVPRERLTGPTSGPVTLPDAIGAYAGIIPGAAADLDDEAVKVAVYGQVLRWGDAVTIAATVNAAELVRLWPRLELPTVVREAWTMAWATDATGTGEER